MRPMLFVTAAFAAVLIAPLVACDEFSVICDPRNKRDIIHFPWTFHRKQQ